MKKGHIADPCRNKMKGEWPRSKIKQIQEESEDSESERLLIGLQKEFTKKSNHQRKNK